MKKIITILIILLQLLMQMERFLGHIERHTFRMIIIIRKSSISHREILALKFGILLMRRSVWESAGINGSLRQHVVWHYKEQNCYFIQQQSVLSRLLSVTVCHIGEDVCKDMLQLILYLL